MSTCIVCGNHLEPLHFYLDHPLGKICGTCVAQRGAGFGDQFPVDRLSNQAGGRHGLAPESKDAALRALAGTGTDG
ncbi:MAG: hypothetical protein AB7E47_06080 [Desulfovibrionaceae bacterium]